LTSTKPPPPFPNFTNKLSLDPAGSHATTRDKMFVYQFLVHKTIQGLEFNRKLLRETVHKVLPTTNINSKEKAKSTHANSSTYYMPIFTTARRLQNIFYRYITM
jgi:hypothetical protein